MAKIVSVPARAIVAYGVDPTARFLLRRGVSPNAVTVAGTIGVLVGAWFGAQGMLLWGTVIVTAFALTDALDGTMARMRGPAGQFGALLDSSMDRIADGAVFGAVVYYLATEGNPYGGVWAALVCLVGGQVVSYVKARAQSLGLNADVGIAERLERLVILGIGGLLGSADLEWGLPAALWVLAVLSLITVLQRLVHAARSDRPGAAPPDPVAPAGDAS
ncbi:phosphatidylinositol phosphate synthase [Couchioplanes caeruleus]|uniref:Phosphatidylinositol phosphate synthase n=2 Tax=Couchioplanes caeruleus TaxID=56438 RepID=A0A1K0FL04_9ACTN|nr:CDP-alcohol phosphatidyltransferase family protein [Couchioplanes caeruleus]OJF13525.1 CDP-alcohol phosphatidyltransferase [Couchioplanes caeruleus subsp. caeruleus]ROP33235.1 CDP-diacylglycerol--glycerol-3-phosphate 3-phosphatidyltransferase [Couchioplanes caeruleus]